MNYLVWIRRNLKRLDLIHEELQAFIKDFELRHLPTEGRA